MTSDKDNTKPVSSDQGIRLLAKISEGAFNTTKSVNLLAKDAERKAIYFPLDTNLTHPNV